MDADRRERAERAAQSRLAAEERASKHSASLARWSAPVSPLEKALAEPRSRGLEDAFVGPLFSKVQALRRTDEVVAHLRAIEALAPRLIDADYMPALIRLQHMPHVRPIGTWEPRGKGREALFRSLAEHLLAKYQTPTFLWSALFGNPMTSVLNFVSHVASGGSVHDGVKKGLLPVPLTRRMCHDLMQTPSDVPFLRAIRRAEALSCGVDTTRFLNAWMASGAGRALYTIDDETFWLTVMEWFGKNPMIDPNQIGPLVDFIAHRHRQEATYSLKGRTGVSLVRAMEEWHAELAKTKFQGRTNKFNPSGFKTGEFDRSRYDETKTTIIEKNVWHVREVLTAKELAEEGRHMHHCVYSYSWSIERGTTSIWSMTRETWSGEDRCITIEVNNRDRRIVQARGTRNRAPLPAEKQMLLAWANHAGLQLGTYL